MVKFYENKIFIFASLFLIFGAIAVIASSIGDSGYSGIQVENYFTGSGKQGITQNVSFNDSNDNEHLLQFEDGLLVNYSVSEIPINFPSEGLIAYYKLDGVSGNVTDISGNGNDGIDNGANRGFLGIVNKSFKNNGTNQYVNLPQGMSDALDWTLNGWVYLDSYNNYHYGGQEQHPALVSFGGDDGQGWEKGLSLGIKRSTGEVLFSGLMGTGSIYDFYVISPSPLGLGNWHMITGIKDGSNFSLYVDGSYVGSDQQSNGENNIIFNFGYSTIGAQKLDNQDGLTVNGLDGRYDEVSVWAVPLSESEIQILYNNGEGLTYPQ